MSSDPDARPSVEPPDPAEQRAGVRAGAGDPAEGTDGATEQGPTARVVDAPGSGVGESGAVPGADDDARPGGTAAPPAGGTPFGPRALRKPGRTETRMKDMLGALLILIPIALLIVGVGQSCSFAPVGPAVDPGAGPRVDAAARLAEYARTSTFPIRVPDVPWRSNATDRGPVGGGTAVRAGYLTEQGRYLRLVQSDAGEEALLRAETGGGALSADGLTPAAGLNWVTYRNATGEAVRVATASGVRLLITGSGTDDEFRALADATVRARVLPPGGGTG